MQKIKQSLLLITILAITLSCGLPFNLSADQTPIDEQPVQLPEVSSQAPTPLPQVSPTPLPLDFLHSADDALFAGDYAKALAGYQDTINQTADKETRAAAYLGIGRVYYLSRDYNRAIDNLTTMVEGFPDSAYLSNAYFFLGQCYSQTNQFDLAAQAYQSFLNLRPGVLDAYVNELRGDALNNAGNFAAAKAAYQAAYDAPELKESNSLLFRVASMDAALGDHEAAIRQFMTLYDNAANDYEKAQANLLAGQSYLALGLPDQAYARFQDSVTNFPTAYDSYSALVALVNSGVEVNYLNRGMIDYYVGEYALAEDALSRYIKDNPDHDGSALHYRALSRRANGRIADAIIDWDLLIANYPENRFYIDAWDEKAYTLWTEYDKYTEAAQLLIDFVNRYSTAAQAPSFLFEAARIYERGFKLPEAAATWERLANEYPSSELAYRGLFLSGITHYRLSEYETAQVLFQRTLVLGIDNEDQSMSHFWIGKSQMALNLVEDARTSWDQANRIDPTGYYSGRALEMLLGEQPFSATPFYNLDIDLNQERVAAEAWLRERFAIAPEQDLSSLGSLYYDPRTARGNASWELGLYTESSEEFESLRTEIQQDAASSYRLMNHLVSLGLYRTAAYASRQILDLANLDDAGTFTAPIYFNHIRFGIFFKDSVLKAAQDENFHPLFLFSVLRQESLFDRSVQSAAGARGLMQIMPVTGTEIASQLGVPIDYTADDLYRPVISIQFGAHYLSRLYDYFNGNLVLTLAGYNGGPGNANIWNGLSNGDTDLFIEAIRYDETRQYVKTISEIMHIYRRLYEGGTTPG
jgi:soluble lytic murein transglycosylase